MIGKDFFHELYSWLGVHVHLVVAMLTPSTKKEMNQLLENVKATAIKKNFLMVVKVFFTNRSWKLQLGVVYQPQTSEHWHVNIKIS